MSTGYKLTNQTMRTHGDCQWTLGEDHFAPGGGPLCTDKWLHEYTDPLVAVFANSIHANIENPRLFVTNSDQVLSSFDGLKIGCTRQRLMREIAVPVLTTEQRVHTAILCVLEIPHSPEFAAWARNWLDGSERTKEAAARERAAWAAADKSRNSFDLAALLRRVPSVVEPTLEAMP